MSKPSIKQVVALFICLAQISTPLACLPAYAKWGFNRQRATHDAPPESQQPVEQSAEEVVSGTPGTSTISSAGGGTLLKGGISYCVPKGTPIKLKLAACPTMGLKLMDRDLDGNLHPAKEGQTFTARVSEDIFVENNRVIPEGTTLYGKIARVNGPRRNGRPGHLDLSFDKLKLPDGRSFAFRAEADNFRKSTWKSKARGMGRLAAYAGGGAVVGTMVGYQLFGMEGTASMHGYNLAAGAAAGAIMATGYALWKRGPKPVLEPGDDLNMSIDMDLLMPATVAPTKKKELTVGGLNMQVTGKKRVDDGLGNKLLRLDMQIENNTSHPFKSINMFLLDTNGNMNPISAGAGWDGEMMFTIQPHSVQTVRVYFQMEWPKLKHKIVILDHRSRRPLHEIKID